MTIAICCTLADGVVLGTDSAITVAGALPVVGGQFQPAVLKVYNEAEKLFGFHNEGEVGGLPAAIVTFGLATLGNRTLQSFVREFELDHSLKDLAPLKLEKLATELQRFFRKHYLLHLEDARMPDGRKVKDLPAAQWPVLAMFLGGFSPDEPLPEAWEINVHSDDKALAVKQIRKPGDFGSNWGGEFNGVMRFHKGYDPVVIQAVANALATEFKVDPSVPGLGDRVGAVIQRAVGPFEYQVPFAAMPLQEGIDYVKFLLDMMILQHRFVMGAPTCGGPVRIAVVRKQEGFKWVSPRGFAITST